METIYSRIYPKLVIARLITEQDFDKNKIEISNTTEIIQGSIRILQKNDTVPAHFHIPVTRQTTGTAEVWVVFSGEIQATLYDLNDEQLAIFTISAGSILFLYKGGHSLKCLSQNANFFEVKSGPYLGSDKDKRNIQL